MSKAVSLFPGAVIAAGDAFDGFAGRAALVLVLGRQDWPTSAAALDLVERHRDLFDGKRATLVGLSLDTPDPIVARFAKDGRGHSWAHDPSARGASALGAVHGEGKEQKISPRWVLLDIRLRVIDHAPIAEGERMIAALHAYLALDEGQAITPAPVLVVPRVFEPELCRRLIDIYERRGGQESGVYRVVDGETVRVIDNNTKRRSDVYISDPAMQKMLGTRMGQVLFPMIKRAFQFDASRIERFNVVCYDGADGGYFAPHRDDVTAASRHRRFACTINLNAEDYEGGDLRFPEFGGMTYRAPTGGAVVFSCSLMHEVLPMTRGKRYAFLPFLFDEAGARQLAAFQAAQKADKRS